MQLSFIKYGKRKIKVEYVLLKDCFGLYDPNFHTLQIDKRLKGLRLFNTLYHELFHIIMNMENINVTFMTVANSVCSLKLIDIHHTPCSKNVLYAHKIFKDIN